MRSRSAGYSPSLSITGRFCRLAAPEGVGLMTLSANFALGPPRSCFTFASTVLSTLAVWLLVVVASSGDERAQIQRNLRSVVCCFSVSSSIYSEEKRMCRDACPIYWVVPSHDHEHAATECLQLCHGPHRPRPVASSN